MKIVFATGNKNKLREAEKILGENYKISGNKDLGITEDIPETGNTLKENSVIKANYVFKLKGCNCFADDTGLEVDILGGEPGIYSARYAGPKCNFDDNMDKLLHNMAIREKEISVMNRYGIKSKKIGRTARFKTVISLVLDGQWHYFEGTVEGSIGIEKRGTNGFGYDPIFIPDEIPAKSQKKAAETAQKETESEDPMYRCEGNVWLVKNTEKLTLAELGEEEKNMISHRGRALRKMTEFLAR